MPKRTSATTSPDLAVLTYAEAAERYGVEEGALRRLVHRKATPIGDGARRIQFTQADLDEMRGADA